MGEIEKILNKDEMKGYIDELCDDLENFDGIRFIHLLWSNGKTVKSRWYGEEETIIAQLEVSKACLIYKLYLKGET